MTSLLEVSGLKKHFPLSGGLLQRNRGVLQAVDGVSFAIAAGETLAVVGESGSGKSTTGRLVLRLLEPTEGTIRIDGEPIDLAAPPSRAFRKKVQVVFQDPRASLNARRTIYQALRDPLLLHGLAKPDMVREAVGALLERVGLSPWRQFIDRQPRQLSGGQLQRVCIARAVSLKPSLIIADEPVSALDASVRAQILQLVRAMQEQDRLAFLFITHDLAVVRSLAQRVAVMYLGRIVEEGSVEAVFAAPAHPYTAALLAATPVPDPERAAGRRRQVLEGEVPSPANPPSGCRFHTRCPAVMTVCRSVDPKVVSLPSGVSVACHLHTGEKRA
jgi:oligopeptide/dipeptide ABC transporter ATP-binding protein